MTGGSYRSSVVPFSTGFPGPVQAGIAVAKLMGDAFTIRGLSGLKRGTPPDQ